MFSNAVHVAEDPAGLGARAYTASFDPGVHGAIADWLPLAKAVRSGRNGDGAKATELVENVLGFADSQARDGVRWARIDLWLRLVAESAHTDGWGHPTAWLTEAELGLRRAGVIAVADACRRLLRQYGAGPRTRVVAGVPEALHRMGVTKREVDVLALLVDRLTNRQIADRLGISPRTVKSHVEHLLAKTGRVNRIELADLAATVHLSTPATGATVSR